MAELDHRRPPRAPRSGSRATTSSRRRPSPAPGRQLPASVTCAWTQPRARPHAGRPPGLWLRPGQPHPHELTGAAIRQAVAADCQQHRPAAPGAHRGGPRRRPRHHPRPRRRPRPERRAGRRPHRPRATRRGASSSSCTRTRTPSSSPTRTRSTSTRADAVTLTCAADPGPDPRRSTWRPRAPWPTPSPATSPTPSRAARARAVELADAIDVDLQHPQRLRLRPGHASLSSPACTPPASTGPTPSPAASRDASDPDLARVFGLDGVPVLDPALPLPGLLGLPLRWVADGPLAGDPAPGTGRGPAAPGCAGGFRWAPGTLARWRGDPHLAFALALASRAGIDEAARLQAALGRPLTGALRELAAPARRGAASGSARRLEPGDGARPADGRLRADCRPRTSCPARPRRRRCAPSRSPWPAAPGVTAPGRPAPRARAPERQRRGQRAPGPTPCDPAHRRRHRHAGRAARQGRVPSRRGHHPRPVVNALAGHPYAVPSRRASVPATPAAVDLGPADNSKKCKAPPLATNPPCP